MGMKKEWKAKRGTKGGEKTNLRGVHGNRLEVVRIYVQRYYTLATLTTADV